MSGGLLLKDPFPKWLAWMGAISAGLQTVIGLYLLLANFRAVATWLTLLVVMPPLFYMSVWSIREHRRRAANPEPASPTR